MKAKTYQEILFDKALAAAREHKRIQQRRLDFQRAAVRAKAEREAAFKLCLAQKGRA